MRSIWATHLVGLLIVSMMGACIRDTGDPEGFRAQLECGIQQSKIEELAARFDPKESGCGATLEALPNDECYVDFGKTTYQLYFSDQELRFVEEFITYAPKGVRVGPKEPLCLNSQEASSVAGNGAIFRVLALWGQLILDDVSLSASSEWSHEAFYTSFQFDSERLLSCSLTDQDFATVGRAVVARLSASYEVS